MNYFSPPIMVLFFVRSGLSFDLGSLLNVSSSGEMPLLLICGLYIVFRALGKYGGAWLGCSLTGKKPNVRNYLGLALFSQASVAIGLGTIAARSLGGEIGHALQTVVMTTSIIYEFIGPVSAKLSLSLSGAISNKLEDVVPEVEEGMTSVEELIERIRSRLLEGELFDRARDHVAYLLLSRSDYLALFPVGLGPRVRNDLLDFALRFAEPAFAFFLDLFAHFALLVPDLCLKIADLLFVFLLTVLSLGKSLSRLAVHVSIVLVPLCHEVLHRLVEQDVQGSEEDREVEQMEQYLLPVYIKWYSRHFTSPDIR
jgi:hypothetical protein